MIYKYDLERNDKNPQSTAIAAYIIHGNYHPFWNHWMVCIIHLRDVEGIKTAVKTFKNATHEIMISSLIGKEQGQQAEIKLENDIVVSFTGQHLQPFDLIHQIGTLSDTQALRVFEKFIQGLRSPDVDFSRQNCRLIDSIVKFEKNVN